MMKQTHRADPSFKYKLAGKYGETLKYCYQCGTCTVACPISRFIGIYRPNKILELVKLGIRSMPQSSAFLFCSACTLCTKGCPQGVRVHEVMQALKDLIRGDANVNAFLAKDFDESLAALAEGMPFPVAYSWICLRPSEEDTIILEALDRALRLPCPGIDALPQAIGKRAAVIGSGPAGLTSAWVLARKGVSVTVYENLPEAGGMMKTGIPSHRLPKHIVDAEIAKIRILGVDIRTNTSVDRAFFNALLESDDVIFVASGAFQNRELRTHGEELPGVVPALDFLREYNLTGSAQVGKNVVVIGGGNVAMDAAGAALRCGAKSVKLFCLEDHQSMPAHAWEIEDAAVDGVEINPGWGVKAILEDDGKAAGVEFIQCVTVFDKDKRFNPVFNEKRTQIAEADMIITAIGQAPDLRFLNEDVGKFRGAVLADPYTLETNLPNVFAGGDAAAGASLIEAILTGKTAAHSMLRYLSERRAIA